MMGKIFFLVMCTLCVTAHAQEVIAFKNSKNASLNERIENVTKQAKDKNINAYWLVYTFERMMHKNSAIGSYYRHHENKTKLGHLLYPDASGGSFKKNGYISSIESDKKVLREVALLIRYKKGKANYAQISNLWLHVDLDNLPILWAGLAKNQQESIQFIKQVYKKESEPEVKETMISAAGLHRKAEGSFSFLQGIIKSSEDSELRENAVFWIGYLNHPQVFNLLKDLAENDRDEDIAEKAVFALYNTKSQKAIDLLIEFAQNAKMGEVREKAVFWLGQIAGKKIADTIDDIAYNADETEIQEKAVFALSQRPESEGIPRLIKIAKTHPNTHIRKKAIFWLGQSESEDALDAIIEMVRE